ncbi:MAG: hypothetical protein AAFY41_19560, partial [Bacteroidota bacterium]
LLISLLFTGCFGLKPAGGKSAKGLYDSFYVGEEGTQYFIEKIKLKNDEGADLGLDFTFRYDKSLEKDATVNFSIFSEKIYKTVSSVTFSNSVTSFSTDSVKFYFNDKKKKEIESRFTTEVPLTVVNELFKNSDWKINVVTNPDLSTFTTKGKTTKAIESLNENLFIFFR